MATTDTCPIAARRARRRLVFERLWVLVTLGYGIARALVVGATLSDYGVDPWLYLAIDLATSIPLGIATARLVCALVDRDLARARRWTLVALAMNFAPDVFVLVVGRDMPAIVYVVLGAVAVVSLTFAVRSIRARVRAARAAGERCDDELLAA